MQKGDNETNLAKGSKRTQLNNPVLAVHPITNSQALLQADKIRISRGCDPSTWNTMIPSDLDVATTKGVTVRNPINNVY